MPTLCVGIDVAKDNLDVCIQPLGKTLRVANTPVGHRELVQVLHPLAAAPADIRDLLDRRNQLVEMRTMETNRRGSTTEKQARKSIEKHLVWINKEVGRLEAELDARIAANPQWKELDRIIQSVPAYGPQVSRTFIGQLPELFWGAVTPDGGEVLGDF